MHENVCCVCVIKGLFGALFYNIIIVSPATGVFLLPSKL